MSRIAEIMEKELHLILKFSWLSKFQRIVNLTYHFEGKRKVAGFYNLTCLQTSSDVRNYRGSRTAECFET